MSDNISQEIGLYREFLGRSIEVVSEAVSDEILNDWMQANWELLVESRVCQPGLEFLTVYGDGADCNDGSSRVWFPEALATHGVKCELIKPAFDVMSEQPITKNAVLDFEGICSWDVTKKQYSTNGCLDFVLCSIRCKYYVLPFENLKFVKQKL